MAQNNKKPCPSCLISQEPYIIRSSFMIHFCKRIISLVLHFFSNFNFWPKMIKNYVVCTPYLRKHTLYDCDFWYTCKMITTSDAFFIFSKFWFSRLLSKRTKKSACLTPYLRNRTSWLWFLIHLCKMMISPAIFFTFSKFWFFFWGGGGGGFRGK